MLTTSPQVAPADAPRTQAIDLARRLLDAFRPDPPTAAAESGRPSGGASSFPDVDPYTYGDEAPTGELSSDDEESAADFVGGLVEDDGGMDQWAPTPEDPSVP